MQPFEKQIVQELIKITCDDCYETPNVQFDDNGNAFFDAKCPNLRKKLYERHYALYAIHEAKIKGESVVVLFR